DGNSWKGSGGGMLERFVATEFGQKVASNCVEQHLSALPNETKLVVLFGLGTKLGYVQPARHLIQSCAKQTLRTVNEIAYRNDSVVYLHVEHFASQGRLIPDWLGIPDKFGKIAERARWGRMAQQAARLALPQWAFKATTTATGVLP